MTKTLEEVKKDQNLINRIESNIISVDNVLTLLNCQCDIIEDIQSEIRHENSISLDYTKRKLEDIYKISNIIYDYAKKSNDDLSLLVKEICNN